jgi:hypothetical protein
VKERPKSHFSRVLVLIAFLSLQAQADDTLGVSATYPQTPEQNQVLDQVREELTNLDRRWYGLMRIRWSDTQKISAGFGAMLVNQPKNIECSIGCTLRGWHFEIEPGLYGVQGGVGWGKLVGESGRTGRLMHTVHFGWNVRGVVLRTWGDSTLWPKSQTLAGIEGGLSIIRLNFSLGFLRSLSSDAAEDWIITTGIGWGF